MYLGPGVRVEERQSKARQALPHTITHVYIRFTLSQGYMMKKGHKRKNWTERWFVLKPNIISYYVSEDLKDKKGDILLDENCCVEVSGVAAPPACLCCPLLSTDALLTPPDPSPANPQPSQNEG